MAKEVITKKAAVVVLAMLLSMASAREIARYDFSDSSSLAGWSTEWKWTEGNPTKGTCKWSSSQGGTVELKVSGAPSSIKFWRTLPEDLEYGGKLMVKFHCPAPLDPGSGFTMMMGPAEPYGHLQRISVAPVEAGGFVVRMPVYTPRFTSGTPFGLIFVVWPGTSTIYVKSIWLER